MTILSAEPGIDNIVLSASCSFSTTPSIQNFNVAGGNGSLSVTTANGCDWLAVSNDSWITITSGASGSGDGMVGYIVGANNGPARAGTMTVAGQTFTVTQDVHKATPIISWSNPADISYGTVLNSTQLNATANVAGFFVYSPNAGTTLSSGNGQPLSVTFTPNDSTNYNSANANVLINVLKATPTINVEGGTFIYDGNTHPASGSVTGVNGANPGAPTFSYMPGGSSAPVNAGSYSVTGSFAGDANYNAASGSATITITKAPATISLSNLTQTYDGSPKSATAFTNPAGLSGVSIPYDGSTTPPTNPGSYAVVASLNNPNYQAPNATGTLVISPVTRPTNIAYTGDTAIAAGGAAALSAVLVDASTSTPTPIANRAVTLTLGSGAGAQSCIAITDNSGVARCAINQVLQPLGPGGTVNASFGGEDLYLTSSTSTSTLVFAYPAGGGNFVIGDLNAEVGRSVTFWGAQWWKLNSLSGGTAPASFKGFANQSSTTPPSCGGTWITDPGNSSDPPGSIPSYMAVIVSSSINQTGSTISGNIRQIVIVRTNEGYAGNPGHAGTGTVVSVFCLSH